MFALCQGKGSLQALQRGRSTEEGKRRNGKEGTSEEDKATDECRVEGASVGEAREGGRVGRPGPEGRGCAGENSRSEVEDSGGRHNLLAGVRRRGNGDIGEDGQGKR